MKILTKDQAKKIITLATSRLADYTKKDKLKSYVLGISGGIDSSVVGIIGLLSSEEIKSQGYNIGIHYYFLKCDSNKSDLHRAQLLAKKFNFRLKEIDLTNWFKTSPLLLTIPKGHSKTKIAKGNIKCRLRMITLYHFAQ
ncbi:MAG: hypothetical protein ABIA56_02660, partial [Actinomycetota bacterium]